MELTPIRVNDWPLYLNAGTVKFAMSSSPMACGAIPKSDSARYPAGESPAAIEGVPGRLPARVILDRATEVVLSRVAPGRR